MGKTQKDGLVLARAEVSANVHRLDSPRVSFVGARKTSCIHEEVGFPVPAARDPVDARVVNIKRRRAQSGQSLVELALVLPLLLLLLVGVIEIGRYAYFDILVANAARAGAQYGAQSLTFAADIPGIKQAAWNDGLPSLAVTPTQLCGCNSGPGGLAGCPSTSICAKPLVYVQVTVAGTFSSLFSYPGLPPSMTLTSTVTMRVSQ
jgi:Flp pilus assembly protein TadG